MVFDFCFEKKSSGQWIDWMDTVDKASLVIPASAKVSLNSGCQGQHGIAEGEKKRLFTLKVLNFRFLHNLDKLCHKKHDGDT